MVNNVVDVCSEKKKTTERQNNHKGIGRAKKHREQDMRRPERWLVLMSFAGLWTSICLLDACGTEGLE
ncbi:Uncharacterized protein APZ42_015417 [Daphnia magna]|uniref:Uncharacterized protein n=1 Tax=Daphnia magna TaxID=35525 RepID=A0A162PFR0_9CRUS|nr:Uncharacterized protein APZ42_015417 [Daphnia magna]